MYEGSACEVWLCSLDEAPSASDLVTLSSEELTRAGRFFQEQDKQRYLAAHVALRRLIGSKTGRPAATLEFLTGHLGKPHIDIKPSWYFNLSHSGNLALIALSSQREVGVDIEVLSDSSDVNGMAEQHFSENELLDWSELPQSQQAEAFYRIWTRKEACVKVTGWGLHLPLATVDVGWEPLQHFVNVCLPDGVSENVAVQSFPVGAGSVGAVAWALA